MDIKKKLEQIEENQFLLEDTNYYLGRRLEELKKEVDMLLKLLYIFGVSRVYVDLLDNKTIDFAYENGVRAEYLFNLQSLLADYPGKTFEQLVKISKEEWDSITK